MRIGIAGEAVADARLVRVLGDRIIIEGRDWITAEVIDAYRQWRGLGGDEFLDLHEAFKRAGAQGLKIHGHFKDEPAAEDARQARAALALFADEPPDGIPALVVIVRDLDGHPERVEGFRQARDAGVWPFDIVLAAPQPSREAWCLAAFRAETEAQTRTLRELRRELGFDPATKPERLKSGRRLSKRSVKRVLAVLGDAAAVDVWLASVPLELLTERGAGCGLRQFIEDFAGAVRTHLG